MDASQHCRRIGTGRAVVGRIPKGVDLVGGIKEICGEFGIRNGFIAALIGSLDWGKIVHIKPGEGAGAAFRYSDPISLEGPLELLGGQGFIGTEEGGDLSVHLHISVCDRLFRVFGGHAVEGGNPVAVTGEIVIHEIADAALVRRPDAETGFTIFRVE